MLGAGFATRRAAAAVVSCEGAEGAAGARAIWARAAVAAAVPAPGWTPVGHCNCPPTARPAGASSACQNQGPIRVALCPTPKAQR